MKRKTPLVLCISGHDPSGGAGIHADIESCAALGAHALSVITAHTVQDTVDVQRVSPVAPILLAAQMEALANDCCIGAVKIGLLGDTGQIAPITSLVRRIKVPLVLDPVLRAGGGKTLVSLHLQAALYAQLLPLVDVLTPNAAEARKLAPRAQSLQSCAQTLLKAGCKNVLITGGDEPGDEVINTWHTEGQAPVQFRWPRIQAQFHGAGCTLASAIAALLAQGKDLRTALAEAQKFTHATLQSAIAIGRGRKIPRRIRA